MQVLRNVERGYGAVQSARSNDGNFPVKRHKGFHNGGLSVDFRPGVGETCVILDAGLSLAVVAEAPGFQDAGAANLRDGFFKFCKASSRMKIRYRNAKAGDKGFFGDPVLRNLQHIRTGADRTR